MEPVRCERRAEDVHGDVDQHRPRLTAFSEVKGLFKDLRHQIRPINPPGALHKGPVDFVLRRVRVQVHFLMRMFAVIVGRDVAGDDHHGNTIQRRIGDPGCAVGQAGAQVRQDHRGPARHPRVTIRRMTGDLLMPNGDKVDGAVRHRRQHRDVGVTAQAENMPHTPVFEVIDQVLRDRSSCSRGVIMRGEHHQATSRP